MSNPGFIRLTIEHDPNDHTKLMVTKVAWHGPGQSEQEAGDNIPLSGFSFKDIGPETSIEPEISEPPDRAVCYFSFMGRRIAFSC